MNVALDDNVLKGHSNSQSKNHHKYCPVDGEPRSHPRSCQLYSWATDSKLFIKRKNVHVMFPLQCSSFQDPILCMYVPNVPGISHWSRTNE